MSNSTQSQDERDRELIARVQAVMEAAERFERERAIKVLARQFGWGADTTSKVVGLAGVAHHRGEELRGKRGRRPKVELEVAGGAAGADIIKSYYWIGLRGFKKNGRPWLTIEQAIEELQIRKRRRLKSNGYGDDGARSDNSARGRAREHLRGWLEATLPWLPARHLSRSTLDRDGEVDAHQSSATSQPDAGS
ncbi:hypothetical protein ML401_20565 [Bradyrhizobium sp. 62B]|uniref:hypothetical protein n=1 Tax=Bradyrhizobium sp. 62B TaxID=2898442 RepID=UPI0025582450|nr:hypothetical protein ML401_20565 [Bradyrhizobium sp. 62B]